MDNGFDSFKRGGFTGDKKLNFHAYSTGAVNLLSGLPFSAAQIGQKKGPAHRVAQSVSAGF